MDILLLVIVSIILIIFFYKGKNLYFAKKVSKDNKFDNKIPINNDDNIILKLHEKRDELEKLFNEVGSILDIEIECFKSSYFEFSTWVSCRIITKKNKYISKESFIEVELFPIPFYIYDITYSIELNMNNRRTQFTNVIEIEKSDIIEIFKAMVLDVSDYVKYKPKRYTFSSLVFWRKKNKLLKKFRCSFFHFTKLKPLYLYFSVFERPLLYKITTGKPSFSPRSLVLFDVWQTVIPNIGDMKKEISKELKSKLSLLLINGDLLEVNIENISYGTQEYEDEREQLVCILNRAFVIVHIYNYSNNLYIGWNAYLNYAVWEEYNVGEGCFGISLYSVRPIWKEVSQYDLNDTNFLLEIVHANIMQILKRTIKEKEIDQEIDFHIVRESRKAVLKAINPNKKKKKKFSRFKRLFEFSIDEDI